MINNTTLIQKAENRENFKYRVLVYVNASWQDISEHVYELSIDTSALNIETFEPVTAKATLSLRGDFLQFFIDNKDVVIQLEIESDVWLQVFAGTVETAQARIENISKITQVTALDYTQVLKKKTISATFENIKFYEANNTNCLVYKILQEANLQNNIALEDDSYTFDFVSFENTTLYDALKQAFQARGAVFDITSGFLRKVNIAQDTYSAVYTINKIFEVEKKQIKTKNVSVTGYLIESKNEEVYRLTEKQVETTNECYIAISANVYYPDTGFAIAEINDENIINLANVTANLQTAGGQSASVEIQKTEKNKIYFRIKNNTSQNITIIKCRFSADVKRIVSEHTYAHTINNTTDENITIDNRLLTQQTAELLANRLAQRLKPLAREVAIDTIYVPFLELGDIINVVDNFSDISAIYAIQSIRHNISISAQTTTLTLHNVEAITSQATVTQTANVSGASGGVINAVNAAVSETLQQLSQQNTQGINGSGWTNIPTVPVLDRLTTRNNFVNVVIKPQRDLSNFEKYEFQVSKDGTTWTKPDGAQGTAESFFDAFSFIVPFNVDSDGKNIDTNIKIRIRTRTRAGLLSDWLVTDYITLQANLTTNNLGTVFADGVVFDGYNYLYAQNFRLGGANSYIQYANGNLSIASGNMQIANGEVVSTLVKTQSLKINNAFLYIPDDFEKYLFGGTAVDIGEGYVYNQHGERIAYFRAGDDGDVNLATQKHIMYLRNMSYTPDAWLNVSFGRVYYKLQPLLLKNFNGLPPIVNAPASDEWVFKKEYTLLTVNQTVQPLTQNPVYTCRLGVGEEFQVEITNPQSSQTYRLPVIFPVIDNTTNEEYEIDIINDGAPASTQHRLQVTNAASNGWLREWYGVTSSPFWNFSDRQNANGWLYLPTQNLFGRIITNYYNDGTVYKNVYGVFYRSPSSTIFNADAVATATFRVPINNAVQNFRLNYTTSTNINGKVFIRIKRLR